MSLARCLMIVIGGPIDDVTRRVVLSIAAEIRTADPGLAMVQCDGLRGHVYSAALQVKHDRMKKDQPSQAVVLGSSRGTRIDFKVSHAKWRGRYSPKRSLPQERKHQDGQDRRRQRMGRLGQTDLCAVTAS